MEKVKWKESLEWNPNTDCSGDALGSKKKLTDENENDANTTWYIKKR